MFFFWYYILSLMTRFRFILSLCFLVSQIKEINIEKSYFFYFFLKSDLIQSIVFYVTETRDVTDFWWNFTFYFFPRKMNHLSIYKCIYIYITLFCVMRLPTYRYYIVIQMIAFVRNKVLFLFTSVLFCSIF